MYVPYMYGRRYELLAVRMMLRDDSRDLGMLMPLVEPVMAQVADLRRCIEACGKSGQSLAIIANPRRHELKNVQARDAWLDEVIPLLYDSAHVIPIFRCDESTGRRSIERFFRQFDGRSVGIFYSGVSLRDDDLRWLFAYPSVAWHMADTDHVVDEIWRMMPRNRLIVVRDCFHRMIRNADYEGTEFFTDRHQVFRDQAAGIGDYLCLGREFISGGSTPAAVAIHACYKNSRNDDLWIEHFVSDDRTRGEGDTAGKFVQAARKLAAAVRRRPAEFGSNPALREFARLARTEEYSGLGENKKLQMVHHMCLVLDVLQGRLE